MAGPIRISILANASQASKTFKGVSKDASSMGSKVTSAGKTITKVGLLAGTGAAVAIGGLFVKGIKDAAAYQKITAQTNAVLKSTKGAAGISAKGVAGLANKVSDYSGVADETIQSNENLLLTFTNIQNKVGKGNKIFTRATKTASDMSTALGEDGKSASIQLGKALNDPIKGITALSRVGVTFTAGQKKQITAMVNSGHTMKAQKVILGELHKEFGGSAKAAGDTFSGSMSKLKNAFGDFIRDAVTPLLPKLTQFADFMTKKGLPATEQFAAVVKDKLGQATDKVRSAFEKIQPTLQKVIGFIKNNPATVKAFAIALGVMAGALVLVTLATAAWTAVLDANPISIVVLALAAMTAGLVYAYQHSAKFKSIVDNSFKAIKAVTAAVFPVIKTIIKVALKVIGTYFKVEFAIYKAIFRVAWAVISGIVKGAIALIRTDIAAVRAIIGVLQGIWTTVRNAVSSAWGAVTKIVSDAIGHVVDFVSGLKSKVTGAMAGAAGWLLSAGKAIIQGLIDGIGDMISSLQSKLGGITKLIPHWKGPPSKDKVLLRGAGRSIIQGLIDGFHDGEDGVHAALSKITTKISKGGFDSGGIKIRTSRSSLVDSRGVLLISGAPSTAKASKTVHLTVQAPVGSDPYTIGEQLKTFLDAYLEAS